MALSEDQCKKLRFASHRADAWNAPLNFNDIYKGYSIITKRHENLDHGTYTNFKNVFDFYLSNKRLPTYKEFNDNGWGNRKAYNNILGDVEESIFLNSGLAAEYVNNYYPDLASELLPQYDPTAAPVIPGENITPDNAQDVALSQYYTDLYSLNSGTGGAEMLDRLTQAAANEAQANLTLADAQFQQQAAQQAQTVKNITDQVRAERMQRLRAGMSQSQIANQDMQMLLNNTNALNQSIQEANNARLQAQTNLGLAADTAYQQYLDQANARGQIAAATYAADVGNPMYMAAQLNNVLNSMTPTERAKFLQNYSKITTGS